MITYVTDRTCGLTATGVLCLAASAQLAMAATPPVFKITALDEAVPDGVTPADAAGAARSINNNGESVGTVWPVDFEPFFNPYGLRWDDQHVVTELLWPSEWGVPDPWSINDHGEMAGYAVVPVPVLGGAVNHAIYYSDETGAIDVTPDIEGGAWSLRINNNGVLCGFQSEGGDPGDGFIWSLDDGMTLLQHVPAHWSFPAYPQDINDNTVVVGNTQFPSGFNHAFIWTQATGLELLPMHDNSVAFAVNNDGVIVGQGSTPGMSPPGCVPPDICPPLPHGVYWEIVDGEYERVPIFPFEDYEAGQAFGINAEGWIIGLDERQIPSIPVFATEVDGWLWIDGAKYQLLDLIDPVVREREGWQRIVPAEINDKGQIVGHGQRIDDPAVPILLTPLAPLSPADLDGDGAVGPADLAILLGAWGSCPTRIDCPTDLDGDSLVGPADLALLLGAWS